MIPRNAQRAILNWCNTCQKDFGSVSAFDAHRTGTFEYDYPDGLKLNPPRENGRRCLTTKEMLDRGMRTDQNGRWRNPAADAPHWRKAA